MLKFTQQQQIAENTIIDQIILETTSGEHQTISVNKFKGAVVVDPNLGNYVVIDFTVTDTAAMNIGRIRLMHGQTPVAISEDTQLLIVKEANKNLKIRLAAQFAGAENCKFNTTSVNLPYATPFREGVVRFYNGGEVNKSGTVYSAADVDAKIDAVTESLGDLKDYAKINAENTFAENNTFTKNVIVNGEISGNAVATREMTINEKDAMVVSLGYADNKYLTKTDAGNTYLTKTDATNYAKLNGGNTFTGDVNTFKAINATKFSGDGVVKSITDSTQDDAELIPTDGAVKTYVDGKITDLHNKDFELQSQIDGINAGQNLADIVNNTTKLEDYDVSHLKAKDDFQHGESGAKWAIGDKVQVLGGGNVQSSVYELVKGQMPGDEGNIASSSTGYYWRYIGVYGISAYTKAEIDTKVGEINNAIRTKADASYVNTELGKKANSVDVYSKAEANGRFAQLAVDNTFTGNNTFNGASTTINGTIIGDAVTSDIATDIKGQGVKLTTSSGVSNFVTKVVNDKITELQDGMSYLKLTSDTVQTVDSSVTFNGIISGTAVADVAQPTEAGRKLVTVDYVNDNCAKLHADNVFSGKSNTFQTISAQTVDAQTFTGVGVTPTQMSEEAITQGGDKIVSLGFAENRYVRQGDISSTDKIGSMGLFLYTGGDFKERGAEVHGSLLHEVGMQLPMDGVVSWSQGTAVSTAAAETTWKLLNNTIAGEPCLVLAIRVG